MDRSADNLGPSESHESMPIRIEVLEDLTIEIMRMPLESTNVKFLRIRDREKAERIVIYLMRREMRAAAASRFIPRREKERKRTLFNLFRRT